MYQVEQNKEIRGADYSEEYLDGEFKNVKFTGCDFRWTTIAGHFEHCIFDHSCLFEDTQWPGDFWDCSGVGQ